MLREQSALRNKVCQGAKCAKPKLEIKGFTTVAASKIISLQRVWNVIIKIPIPKSHFRSIINWNLGDDLTINDG